MDRAEQVWKAQETAYNEMMKDDTQYCHPESFRWGFEQGVEWAEKNLALTWKDIKLICDIDRDTNHEEVLSEGDIPSNEEHYEEVLRRFNEIRKK